MENTSVSVVHPVWIPYGIQLFKGFIDSYTSFSAGYPHQLILLFNGVDDEKQITDYHTYINQSKVVYISHYYKRGQDLEAYRWVAGKIASDHILFLNSYSRFRAHGWLLKFMEVSVDKSIGLIGATGSWQSYYSTIFKTKSWQWSKNKTIADNLANYKLLLKAFLWWRWYFKPFPNPHIRTNAFFINRKIFLSITYKNPASKFDAYCIESGKKSITKQILDKGLKVVIINISGIAFEIPFWNGTKIFWAYNQENLLIADNQTEWYANSDVKNKQLLEKLAWG